MDPGLLRRGAKPGARGAGSRGVRANLLAEVTPSEAIVDTAAARAVKMVRSHRPDIDSLRGAAAVLLSELSAPLLNLI
ncbi:MAG: hypothetical protein ACREYC_13330 [Gammaproteobacteria bacterium]